jgi:MipA family protein
MIKRLTVLFTTRCKLISESLMFNHFKHKIAPLSLLGVAVFASPKLLADEFEDSPQTIFEIGVGLSVVDIPHYAGSEQSDSYALPFPYFKYESKKVSVNRDGLKRYLLRSDNWDLDISFSGSVPVDSGKNRARQGMPDLDWVGLAGPAYNYQIFKNQNHRVKFSAPLRFGVATDFSQFDAVGWDFAPRIQWRYRTIEQAAEWNVISSIGVEYGSSDYNDYYYSVAPEYQTAIRNAYRAKSGYAGYKLTLGINRREGKLWLGAFTRYRNLGDASFADSPLVTATDNFYIGLAAAWIIRSERY